MSNTKLTKEAKAAEKLMRAVLVENGGAVFANEFTGVTVAVCPAFPGSNTVRVSTSVTSPDEKKFRPSVGRYVALNNMDLNVYVVFPVPQYELVDLAVYLSEAGSF